MRYELLRNCSHGSKIYTSLVEDSDKKYYLKSSSCLEGIENLNQEYEGWNWYFEKANNLIENPTEFKTQREKYVSLRISAFEGEKIKIKCGIKKNYNFFIKIIKHYKEIWKVNKNKVPMHGDLSLENIIFRNNGVTFIDWEHFSRDCTYWGFDVYYLLYETLWFNWQNIYASRNVEIFYLSKLIKILNYNLNFQNKEFFKLSYLINFINNNKELWSNQLLNNLNKLPLLNFEYRDVKYVDNLVSRFVQE